MGSLFHGYLSPQGRGVITLPAALRKRLHLDQPGAQLEVIERPDGVFELRSALPVPADEAWFWQEQWQAGEREVDEHVRHGRVRRFEADEEFLQSLDAVESAHTK